MKRRNFRSCYKGPLNIIVISLMNLGSMFSEGKHQRQRIMNDCLVNGCSEHLNETISKCFIVRTKMCFFQKDKWKEQEFCSQTVGYGYSTSTYHSSTCNFKEGYLIFLQFSYFSSKCRLKNIVSETTNELAITDTMSSLNMNSSLYAWSFCVSCDTAICPFFLRKISLCLFHSVSMINSTLSF